MGEKKQFPINLSGIYMVAALGAGALTTQGEETNSLGMKFVAVPGTQILMCTTETTVAQYKQAGLGYQAAGFPQGPTHPAVNISWNDAQAFCKWLSKKEGKKYRLPTDAEWSAAVGPGKYPWGDGAPTSGVGNYMGQEMRSLSEADRVKYIARGLALILQSVNPRLCRGDSQSLTYSAVLHGRSNCGDRFAWWAG